MFQVFSFYLFKDATIKSFVPVHPIFLLIKLLRIHSIKQNAKMLSVDDMFAEHKIPLSSLPIFKKFFDKIAQIKGIVLFYFTFRD